MGEERSESNILLVSPKKISPSPLLFLFTTDDEFCRNNKFCSTLPLHSEILSVLSAKISIECFSINPAMFAAQEIQSADLVRELRFRLGLTQEQFAAELGVTFASINRWENRKVQPSPMALKLLRNRLEQMGDRGTDLLDRYF
jgi:DNA-binding transcriptional regulator YiaG